MLDYDSFDLVKKRGYFGVKVIFWRNALHDKLSKLLLGHRYRVENDSILFEIHAIQFCLAAPESCCNVLLRIVPLDPVSGPHLYVVLMDTQSSEA